MESLAVLGIALAIDRLGEPPARFHPVCWLGTLIGSLTRLAPPDPRRQLAHGVLIATVPGIAAALTTAILERLAGQTAWPAQCISRAILLSWTFSLAGLERAVFQVQTDLNRGDVTAARSSVMALVSRSTDELTEPEIAAASIESLAENASDSIVGPLLWWRIGGLPAAAAYRAINTADAMVGYHGRYEYLGRVTARLDDLMNLLPARLTGAAICLASLSPRALRIMLQEHGRTESPNAGWPMAAMAGALQCRLSKAGHYSLGASFTKPSSGDITRAVTVFRRATILAIFAILFIPDRPR
ncbi:MAG: adenosylcobinamide-phosphate synthase CbiB [Chloroflexota bacterium]